MNSQTNVLIKAQSLYMTLSFIFRRKTSYYNKIKDKKKKGLNLNQ